jgi:cell division protein FtsI/penicillin-binding protein 2
VQTGTHVKRQKVIIAFVILMWVAMAVKIGAIQILDHDQLSKRAQSQRSADINVTGARGEIFDRNGEELAVNRNSASYALRYKEGMNAEKVASVLCPVTGIDPLKIKGMIESKKNFQWFIRQASPEMMSKIDSLKVNYVEKTPEVRRVYPLGKIASQLLGWTDIDGKGIDGCEFFLDDNLAGRSGRISIQRDGKKKVTSLDKDLITPQDGLDIVLTIDWRIQEIAEEELEAGVLKFNAESGGAIVIDSQTGEILAMANAPRFDANDPASFGPNGVNPKFRKNRLITDMIEPGSTFKIVAFTQALEDGTIKESDMINCENGKYRIGRHTIKDSHPLGIVPAEEVLIESSNIGTLKIADMLGKKKLYERARMMGFGEVTGFDLPNESPGDLPNPSVWSNLSLPTISFGQGVAVSPLQVSIAYSAIANGGNLMAPRIIKEIKGNSERPGRISSPKIIRRAMTKETADRMVEILSKVVEMGTGKSAEIANVRIAGKTGTAQRVIEGVRGYAEGQYTSSFIGFLVDRNPRLVCLVMVDNPVGTHYGSQVAAPIFRNIMNRIINMGDSPVKGGNIADSAHRPPSAAIIVPDVKGASIRDTIARMSTMGFKTVVIGDTTMVGKQFPLPGAQVAVGSTVTLYGNTVRSKTGGVEVPNLEGSTLREAVQSLVQMNLKAKVRGSGTVELQDPPAGTVVSFGSVCTIICGKTKR